jgi:D-aspartate ligase
MSGAKPRRDRVGIEFDRGAPVLVVKIGPFPVRPSALGTVRSLGRVGVPVHVITSGSLNADAASRYAVSRHEWRTTGQEEPERLVADLIDIAGRIGNKPIVVCTDDEAAVLVAEHMRVLEDWVTAPGIRPGLPRMLASKRTLVEWCRDFGVLTPGAVFPTTRQEVEEFSRWAQFPVIAKNPEPFTRLKQEAVGSTRRIDSAEDLLAFVAMREEPFDLLLQEYLPRESSEDWFTHAYAANSGDEFTVFTGRKLRSWPTFGGVTVTGVATPNEELAQMATGLLRSLDYRGPADLDWRRDLRDGGYRLLDFNPRVGGQFRIFQGVGNGIDIARLLHLDLTNRPTPSVHQLEGLRFLDELFVLPSTYAIWKQSGRKRTIEGPRGGKFVRFRQADRKWPEFAWFAFDDPLPFLSLVFGIIRALVVGRVRRKLGRIPGLRNSDEVRLAKQH